MELDVDVLEAMLDTFRLRFLNQDEGGAKIWEHSPVNRIPKIRTATHIRQFRPVAIISVLFTLYARVLGACIQGRLDQDCIEQFAFKKHHECGEVLLFFFGDL